MDITVLQEENLNKIIEKYLNVKFIDRLIIDFEVSQLYAEGIIRTAAVADLYIEIKGARECKLIGFNDKAMLLEAILLLSNKYCWTSFQKLTNVGSLIRKMRGYKKAKEKGIYEGISFLVSKKESNMVSKNARKITDIQIEALQNILTSESELSKREVYAKMRFIFKELKVKQGVISHYARNLEVDKFKNKLE